MNNQLPPKDEELEEKVLGSLLSSVEVPPVCMPLLSEDDFYRTNKQVFALIRDDYNKHGDVDHARVESRLKEVSGSPEADAARMMNMSANWIPPDKAEDYCRILNGLAAKRRVLKGITEEANAINARTPEELLTNLESIVHDNIGSANIPGLTPSQIEARDEGGRRGEQILTGDKFMDNEFFARSGSRRGQLIVPFGGSGHGKTFWATWLAARYLERGYKGVFCVFESTDSKIKDRIKANMSDTANLDNIIIADVGQGMMSLEDSTNLIKYHNARMDIDFFVADHMRIIPVGGLPDWKENEKVTVCVNRYMRLAQEVDAHGVALSQVNRATTTGKSGWDNDPGLNNLYGSSAIEQAAEMAISIFRPKEFEELHDYWPSGDLRAVRGPSYETDSKTYDPNSVFIRQKKTREGERYLPYVRFLHGNSGLKRAPGNR